MMNKFLNRAVTLLFFCLLISCKSDLDFNVIELELLDQKTVFSDNNSSLSAIGLLKATIEAEVDIIQYAKDNSFNLWFTVKTCDSDLELSTWPYFYRNIEGKKLTHRYEVIFDYKNIKNSGLEYNLAKNPQKICFVIGAANMNPLSGSTSKVIQVPLTSKLINLLKIYDEKSGLIDLQLSEECKEQLCVPDYAM